MAKYYVEVAELHKSLMLIEATSEEEALALVEDGQGDELSCEYHSTLDSDEWCVSLKE